MIREIAGRLASRMRRLVPGRETYDLLWWERRVRRAGARSVLNRGHADEEIARVDEWQKRILFPILQRRLRGGERVVLDFGCGPGRFTPDLAGLIGGRAIGVDPMQRLLDLAPRSADVEYRLLRHGRIPLADDSVDVVWICLVLMCICDRRALERSVAEIERVLRTDGLVFLVENTERKADTRHLRYRSIEEYRALFQSVDLEHEADYQDLDERISILAGRADKADEGA